MKENIVEEFDDLADLLARKKSNLAMQARLREESKDLDCLLYTSDAARRMAKCRCRWGAGE